MRKIMSQIMKQENKKKQPKQDDWKI